MKLHNVFSHIKSIDKYHRLRRAYNTVAWFLVGIR